MRHGDAYGAPPNGGVVHDEAGHIRRSAPRPSGARGSLYSRSQSPDPSRDDPILRGIYLLPRSRGVMKVFRSAVMTSRVISSASFSCFVISLQQRKTSSCPFSK